LAVLFALLAAVFMAVGIVVRQRATMDVPPEKGVSTLMLMTLVRRPLWWAGTGSAVAGFVFQALALGYGSLILVQPILVSALLFALPLSARLAGRRVSRAEWLWAVLLTAALTVFVALAKAKAGDYDVSVPVTVGVAVVCGAAVLGCIAIAVRAVDWRRAVLLAVAVGVLFGVVAVLTKIVMHNITEGRVEAVLTTPALYLVVLLGVGATLLQQSAFHAGSLQTSVPTMLVLEPAVAVVLGSVLLGEHLSITGWEPVALVVAIAAMVAATIALGREEGAYEAELEAVVRQP
jgi:drug/metabolite transporter (DMT)-like permease